jgi:hypothetical protein
MPKKLKGSDFDVDGRIILKWTLDVSMWIEFIWSSVGLL